MADVDADDWFSLGYAAQASGLSLLDCPYPDRTQPHEMWSSGWTQARFADIDENVFDAPRAIRRVKSLRTRREATV